MGKNIWIINHYATGMYFNGGGRHHWLAKNLIRDGYKVTIFCSNYRHNSDDSSDSIRGDLYEEKMGLDDVKYIFVKTSPYQGNGLSRIKNMYAFYRNVKKVCKGKIKSGDCPDVIMASSVHPLALVAGIKIGKKFNIPCICEVRDLWPEVLVQYGRIKRGSIFAKLLYLGEKWIYKNAGALIFTMEGGKEYIINSGWQNVVHTEKIFHINNGVDVEEFKSNKLMYHHNDQELDDDSTFKIIYAGSINRVNNIGLLLDVADRLKGYQDIKILIFGRGNEIGRLKERVELGDLNNVKFKGSVEKKYIPSIISRSDLNLIHWEMSELLRYGASYNKMFEYLAAGKPILCTVSTGKYSILDKYNCGFEIKEQTIENIVNKILEMKMMTDEEKHIMGRNAENAAVEYDFKEHTKKLVNVIGYVLEKK